MRLGISCLLLAGVVLLAGVLSRPTALAQEKDKKDTSEKTDKVEKSDKKPPIGPLKEGMVFTGVLKTGEPTKKGTLKGLASRNFELKIVSAEGDSYVGHWSWNKSSVIEVDGKVTAAGAIIMRFVKDIKGKSELVFDGQMAGQVSATNLAMKYVRPSGNRVGIVEARIKE